MNELNAQQLAFVLDIKKEDARAKMCQAWEKEKGIQKTANHELRGAKRNVKKKIEDPYPQSMLIEMLARQLNLPDLQICVDDIHQNYLTRSGSKKWILCDYPEKTIKKYVDNNKQPVLNFPPALLSMLPSDTVQTIKTEWAKRFPKVTVA